jgi:hypothetical protein
MGKEMYLLSNSDQEVTLLTTHAKYSPLLSYWSAVSNFPNPYIASEGQPTSNPNKNSIVALQYQA